MILLKLKWSTRGISEVKNFSLLLLAKTRRNPKILASSQMVEMAPENVTTTGTLKLDATRRGAQQEQFKAWSKYFNLKEVLHEKSNHFNLQKNSTSIYSKKQRCSLFFSFKSKLQWVPSGSF